MFNKNRLLSTIFFILICVTTFAQKGVANSLPEKDRERIIHAVSAIYHVDLDEVEITPLEGGLSKDRMYKVIKGEKASVVCVHNSAKSLDKKKEAYVYSKIAFNLGIGSEVQYVSKTFDVIAKTFINGKHPNAATFHDPIMIKTLAKSIKKLHDVPNSVLSRDLKSPDKEMKSMTTQVDKIEKGLKGSSFPEKICHKDLHTNNLFVVDGKILFIDWEDVGMGDPYDDLVRISTEFAFDSKQDELLLSSYFEDITELARGRFFIMKEGINISKGFLRFRGHAARLARI